MAGVAGLYGGYALVLGLGWRFASRSLSRASTRSAQREAAAVGQHVLELRFRVAADGSETDDGVPEVDAIMDGISAALGEQGDCPEAASTGGDYRLFVRAIDVQTAVNAVRRVTARHPLPAGSYLWLPDPRQPRMGSRLALRAAPATPRAAAEGQGAVADERTTSPGTTQSRFRRSMRGLREPLSLEIEWMRMPEAHRALSKVHRSTDVLLRYFHEPLDLVDLELLPIPQTEKLLRFGIREVPPVDHDTDESKLNVWLLAQAPAPAADVMLGSRKLGATHLPPHAWDTLTEEAERGVFADGILEVAPNHRTNKPVVRRFRCYLPRAKKRNG